MRLVTTFRGMLLLAALAGSCAPAQHRGSAPMFRPSRPQTEPPRQAIGQVSAAQQTALLRQNAPRANAEVSMPRQSYAQATAPVARQTSPQAPGQRQQPAPIERRTPNLGPRSQAPANGDHLEQWMMQHRNLSPAQQAQALDREPGFRQLPPNTQQRYRNLLGRLNAMTPQERERWTRRTEAIERLSVTQRAQVRGAMQQLGSLPPDQRRVVARSFRELRQLPADQRSAALSSDRYRLQMNDAQKATLDNLMSVEPLLPPQ